MVNRTAIVAAIAMTSAVAFPYITALACNLVYGWPQVKHRYRRAFNPKKVFALNLAVIQKMIITIRYAAFYFQWKSFYKSATASQIMKDRLYGRNGQKLDLYFPKSHTECGDSRSYPVVIFVYGGTWSSGDKSMYGPVCTNIANKLDAIVCCPNYTLYPKGFADNMVQDMLDTMIWLHQNVEHYKGNKTKLMLVGHSAGAHLCALTMLELLRDDLGLSTENLLPLNICGLQFTERYFDFSRNGNSEEDRHSTGSSGSFYVINGGQNENNGQASVQTGSPVLTAELVTTQISDTALSEGSMLESELRELARSSSGELQYTGTAVSGEQGETGKSYSSSRPGQDDDDEDDDNSVVTLKQNDGGEVQAVFDTQPTRTELSRSLKAVVGLAGVYHIQEHFLHESWRGIEDLSTMARAMRGSENFDRFSPSHILRTVQETASVRFPKVVLLHGTEDYVVPLSSTNRFSEELVRHKADVTVRIIPSCDHYEICLDLMKASCKFHDIVIGIIDTTAKTAFTE